MQPDFIQPGDARSVVEDRMVHLRRDAECDIYAEDTCVDFALGTRATIDDPSSDCTHLVKAEDCVMCNDIVTHRHRREHRYRKRGWRAPPNPVG